MDYIISQVLIGLSYVFLAFSYTTKKRSLILTLNIISLFFTISGYFFLSAWTGLAMTSVALIRTILFLIEDFAFKFKSEKSKKIVDYSVFSFVLVLTAICSYFSYEDFYSLFSIVATVLFTYSVWQKNYSIYLILGPLVSILWIIYNIFVFSILGIILETVLFIVIAIKLIFYFVKNKQDKNNNSV